MIQKVEFQEKQPQYRYFPLKNGKVDIFIYDFIEERKVLEEDTESTIYIYNMNTFRTTADEITEEMVSKNPLKYINYNSNDTSVSIEERVTAIEDAILELAGGVE